MIARSREILARFPAHLEAARPGKVLGDVVDGLARDLDTIAARLAAVRRAHRLGEADEIADLFLIAALHGITRGEMELLSMRFARAGALAAVLHDANDAGRDAAADALVALWSLAAAEPRLPLWAPAVAAGGTPDLNAARTQLLASVTAATRYDAFADALRVRIASICRLHARGNGTVQTLLEGAANALDLDMGLIVSSGDRFWHAALVRDRLRLRANGGDLSVADEIIGLEENPIDHVTTHSVGRNHAERWTITRRGFDRVAMEIRITGIGQRTVAPMIVDCDEGRGFGFAGNVPHGKTLVFGEDGGAMLDGADFTSFAYAWEGACFADEGAETEADFAFGGPDPVSKRRPARFVTTTPPDALDREAVFPHGGDVTLPAPGLPVGVTRFAFFVQEAHFNAVEGAGAVRLVTARNGAAFFDGSVFAPVPPEERQPSAAVEFLWSENRPFSARLLIPARFRDLTDDAEGAEVKRRVAGAVERFRPAGIELTVDFIDHRWVLGKSVLNDGVPADIIEQLKLGMLLWAAPA